MCVVCEKRGGGGGVMNIRKAVSAFEVMCEIQSMCGERVYVVLAVWMSLWVSNVLFLRFFA